MTAITPSDTLVYPSADGKPVAETFDHLYAILTILEVLRQYSQGQRATVLANQFLYYAQGFPKLRVAPDVMVIFDVEPGGRDNYKIWQEGQVPKVIFEITSASTRQEDTGHKQVLYEQLEVEEYWLFDPKGDWIDGQLLGYRLQEGRYLRIADQCSQALNLRLQVEEVEGLGIAQKKELISRLIVLLEHLLKRLYVKSPDDYNGWERTIRTQRGELEILLDAVPSLKTRWDASFDKAWQIALKNTCKEYPQTNFPPEWPYSRSLEAMLDRDFWLEL
ncbi:DUF29 family protein [Leptolyngbya sp. 7M]|uniref:DUF29 family protein n=1 Tax=Leptolyngbya sp. 7M TaxID=2812896 RepID=UPI001B8B18FB|nr:DUF29 family protein [Leptolyngbya sp. 7M]QYO64547.1 DUF29 family protein [Leptolyngbya sp. 7M]